MFGSVQPADAAFNYPEYYRFAWAAALNSIDPVATGGDFSDYQTALGSMVLSDHLEAASSSVGGNPYNGVAAVDPATALTALHARQTWFEGIIDDLDESALTALMAAAATEYDANASTTHIEDVIDASEAASLHTHMEAVGRVHASMWGSRAMMGSQSFMVIASMEHERQRRMAEEEFKLRLFGERERTEGILRLTEALLRQRAVQADGARAVTANEFDIQKLDVTMQQDEIEHNTEMAVREATWDLDLFSYHHQGLAAIAGASTIPRAQTARERLAAAATSSISMGLQIGMATGNPMIGVAAAFLGFGIQSWGMGG